MILKGYIMDQNIIKLKNIIESSDFSDDMILREMEPMSRHTTFRIGGCAKLFCVPKNTDALLFLLSEAKKTDVKCFIMGNGSNLLFDDEGYDGVVISTSSLNSITVRDNKIVAECGAMLSACAVRAKENSLTGLECLFGIPGSVGGAVFMNAGAYGGEMCDVVVKTTYLDPETLEIREVIGDEHKFGYRHSVFKENGGIILNTELSLKEGCLDDIAAAMEDYMTRRITKQPLEFPSAGSTFKRYPGRYTGQMIDESGLKGYTVGGAQVSEKHAGFVINKGNATCKDVLSLIEHIRNTIRQNYGIEIETEVIYVK